MNQRPIKFRAWHKPTATLFDVHTLTKDLIYQDALALRNQEFWGPANPANRDDCILLQFIGLVDEKGVEVYEGDIIEMQYPENGKMVSIYDQIAFVGGCFGIANPHHKGEVSCFSMVDLKDTYVVGTIFTHADLLKDDDADDDDEQVWDAKRYTSIHDVQPVFSGNLTNWVDWEQAFRAAMTVDKYLQSEIDKIDWADLRTAYFNDYITALEAYQDHFYTQPSLKPFYGF